MHTPSHTHKNSTTHRPDSLSPPDPIHAKKNHPVSTEIPTLKFIFGTFEALKVTQLSYNPTREIQVSLCLMASTNTDVVIKRMTSLSYEIVSKQFVWGNTLYNNQINNHNLPKKKKKWGSEIWPFKIQNPEHLKSCLLEGQISNGRALAMTIVPTI